MAKPIGTLGTIPTVTIGGRVFTDLTNLLILQSFTGNASRRGTFRLGQTGYQAVNTLTIYALEAHAASATAMQFQLAYGDTDLGFDSASALVTPVYEFGGYAGTRHTTAAVGVARQFACKHQTPTGKYPAVDFLSSSGTVTAYGYDA